MKQLSMYDYLIIGAGPAGLQLAYFLQKMGRTYLLIEASGVPGSFYTQLPRHGKMISINKIYTGYTDSEKQLRYDWNSLLCDQPQLRVRNYSSQYFPHAAEYQRYLADFALAYQLNIRYHTTIVRVSKQPAAFELEDQKGRIYQGTRLIVATGLGLTPSIPPIPGIELGEHYLHYSIDPKDYKDQRVLIIGKGNGAFETANALTSVTRITHLCSPTSVKMAWETHFMGHVRTVNAEFLDTFYLKGQNALLDARVERLEQRPEGIVAHIAYTHAHGQTMQLIYDRVLLCTGFRFDTSIFDETCQPELSHHGRLPALTAEWESTTIKHLYFAGTLMQMRDYHKTMSNVIHGFRFNIQFLSQLFALKYHHQPLPRHVLPLDPALLAQHILMRASRTAALLLQPGFLCDLLICIPQSQRVDYFENISVDYVHMMHHEQDELYYTLCLEYGLHMGSSRHRERDPNPHNAHNDFYLHPVIRRFCGTEQIDELHLAENLENNWLSDQHEFILTTEVPGRFSPQDMFGYAQRLQAFLQV